MTCEKKETYELQTLQADDSEHLKSLIYSGNQASVTVFLHQKGFSFNCGLLTRGKQKTFPLHVAVDVKPEAYHNELVKYFISEGVGLDVLDERGYAPVHYATKRTNIQAITTLLDAGAKVNLQTESAYISKTGYNDSRSFPLHLALYEELYYEKEDSFKFLHETEKKFTEAYNKFIKAEHTTLSLSLHELVQVLLTYGADCNIVDGNGSAPLHYALRLNDFKMVVLLLDVGADINIRNEEHKVDPPIFLAKHQSMLKYLLLRKSKPELLNSHGESILHVSVDNIWHFVTRYLATETPVLLRVDDGSVLTLAVRNYIDDESEWCDRPQGLRIRDNFDSDMRHRMKNHEKTIRLLLKSGYDPVSAVHKGRELISENFMILIHVGYMSIALTAATHVSDFLKTMEEIASNPRPLQDLCTIKIRGILQRNITTAVASLPLPTRLKKSLTLIDSH